LKLNDRVADSEREPSALFNGKSQRLIRRAQRLQVVAGEDQVVDTFHCQNLHGLLDGQAILLGTISDPGQEGSMRSDEVFHGGTKCVAFAIANLEAECDSV